jgi:hypothetical protein
MSELKLRPREESGKARGRIAPASAEQADVAACCQPLAAYGLLLVPVREDESASVLYAAFDAPALFRF